MLQIILTPDRGLLRFDRHEDRFCRNANYNPDKFRPSTGWENWRRWQFVYTGNAQRVLCVLCWIVPEGDNLGHGGLWSDNSRHHVGCSFSKAFPTKTGGMVTPLQPRLAP